MRIRLASIKLIKPYSMHESHQLGREGDAADAEAASRGGEGDRRSRCHRAGGPPGRAQREATDEPSLRLSTASRGLSRVLRLRRRGPDRLDRGSEEAR